MSFRISATQANQNPAEFYYRTIANCFSANGKPQVLVMSKPEYYAHKRKFVVDSWMGAEYHEFIRNFKAQ